MVFNQQFVPNWNEIYQNLINKISITLIHANIYQSPFTRMLQRLETGDTVEDMHINPSQALVFDTVENSDILNDYYDDIATAYYRVNIDITYNSTYREYVVREGMSLLENVSALISALTANLRVTSEFYRTNMVKQMLYNAYQYGMLSSQLISDPRLSQRTSGKFAIALNSSIDDLWTEINPRNIIYNNQVNITENDMRYTIGKEFPYIIIFNEFVRDVEFENAINLALIERFRTGDSNQDWASRLIRLSLEDWPTGIPQVDRPDVTGSNVPATGVNWYPMPKDAAGNDLFTGVPTGGNTILAIIFEPDALKLFTQLSVQTTWLNPATIKTTNREIYRGIMELGAFAKIKVITCNAGEYIPSDDPAVTGRAAQAVFDANGELSPEKLLEAKGATTKKAKA